MPSSSPTGQPDSRRVGNVTRDVVPRSANAAIRGDTVKAGLHTGLARSLSSAPARHRNQRAPKCTLDVTRSIWTASVSKIANYRATRKRKKNAGAKEESGVGGWGRKGEEFEFGAEVQRDWSD